MDLLQFCCKDSNYEFSFTFIVDKSYNFWYFLQYLMLRNLKRAFLPGHNNKEITLDKFDLTELQYTIILCVFSKKKKKSGERYFSLFKATLLADADPIFYYR